MDPTALAGMAGGGGLPPITGGEAKSGNETTVNQTTSTGFTVSGITMGGGGNGITSEYILYAAIASVFAFVIYTKQAKK